MKRILTKLGGGDGRSIGNANRVVAEVKGEAALFEQLIEGLFDLDPSIRMRAADAVEKISATRPALLRPYKRLLFDCAASCEQKEVRWHMAQICPRLILNAAERRSLMKIMLDYLNDPSRIVKTFAMQAMVDLAIKDKSLLPDVKRHVEELTAIGSPAMRSRGLHLLQKIAGFDHHLRH
jgi:HEAT repeat protein